MTLSKFRIFLALGFAVIAAALTLFAAATPASAQERTYANPTIDGFRLDWCLRWGAACGLPAAEEFCRRMGHDGVRGFARADNIGAQSPTLVLSGNQICRDAGCDGFSRITCRSERVFQVFQQPMAGEHRLDWCRRWGAECGQPAAQEYCRRRGYQGVHSYNKAENIGASTPTQVISSGRVCRQPECDGFHSITCIYPSR